VSRRRKVAPVPGEIFPPAYPTAEALYEHRDAVARSLAACGVASRHLEDVTQDVLIAAWETICEGRYRPDTSLDAGSALGRFLCGGVAWRLASHHRCRAHVRREIPCGAPHGMTDEPVGPDPAAQFEARATLRAVAELPERYRAALAVVIQPLARADYAQSLGISAIVAANRLRIARVVLADRVVRGCR
jgi:RNA polymerase sigma-70 factor, ECF subfamily